MTDLVGKLSELYDKRTYLQDNEQSLLSNPNYRENLHHLECEISVLEYEVFIKTTTKGDD